MYTRLCLLTSSPSVEHLFVCLQVFFCTLQCICVCVGECVCVYRASRQKQLCLSSCRVPQELLCLAYYITELQRKKFVKNETNFRQELLFQSPGLRACIHLMCLSIHLLLFAFLLLGLFTFSSFIVYFYNGNSCPCWSF